MMVTCEALKPCIVAYPCSIADHNVEGVTLVEDEATGEPRKRRTFFKHFAVSVASTRTASPDDVADDAARRADEHANATREGREPMFQSRIFSDKGVAMLTEPGSGPFDCPEETAKSLAARELVRIVGPAEQMAAATPRKSLGHKAK